MDSENFELRLFRLAPVGLLRFVAVLCCLALSNIAVAEPVELNRGQINAAFVAKFANYVNWRSDPGALISVCVVGQDDLTAAISIIEGAAVGERNIRVATDVAIGDLGKCQIVVVGSSFRKSMPEILAALSAGDALTVSLMPSFLEEGGMVGLIEVDNRVRFEIHWSRVKRHGLSISSRLLRLAAKIVEDDSAAP